jgi:hypothetical protein
MPQAYEIASSWDIRAMPKTCSRCGLEKPLSAFYWQAFAEGPSSSA